MNRAVFLAAFTLLVSPLPSAAALRKRCGAEAFGGVGAWVSIFDGPAWARPERVVADMDGHGVATLYLQSASSLPGPAVFRPDRAARFLRAAHARGMTVVAWYLPPYRDPRYELRRALGAIRFRSGTGERFDAFGLDIEVVPGAPGGPTRNRRLLWLSERLRRTIGESYPLGAIIPSPYGMQLPRARHWWPNFPYRGLNRFYDAFLPMGYYTYHGEGARVSSRDTRANLEILRRETADPDVPIHIIGGGSGGSDLAEGLAFGRAVNRYGAIGASMYNYLEMGREDWQAFDGLSFTPASALECRQ